MCNHKSRWLLPSLIQITDYIVLIGVIYVATNLLLLVQFYIWFVTSEEFCYVLMLILLCQIQGSPLGRK